MAAAGFFNQTFSDPGRARAVIVGHPRLLPCGPSREERRMRTGKEQRKLVICNLGRAGPALLSLLALLPGARPQLNLFQPLLVILLPMRTRPGIPPTLVPSRNPRGAGVTRSSRKRRRTEGAFGYSHSQPLSICFYSFGSPAPSLDT